MSTPSHPPPERLLTAREGNRITAVTLFPRQAHVERQVAVTVGEGIQRLLVETTAFQLDPASVQARVRGHGEILSVQYRVVPVARSPVAEVEALEERKRELQFQRRQLGREQESLERRRAFLDNLVAFAATEIPKKVQTQLPTPQELAGTLTFLERGYGELDPPTDRLERRLEELERELASVERHLKGLRRPDAATRQGVAVLFGSTREQTLELTVSYRVEQASWEPVYKVDAGDARGGVALTHLARIVQTTGEPWEGVELRVSNAVPLAGGALPDPRPWRLRMPRPEPLGPAAIAVSAGAPPGERMMGAPEALLEDLEEAAPPPPAAPFQQAVAQPAVQAVEYRLPQPVTLAAAGEETLLPLWVRELPGSFFHRAVPCVDPLVYLVCRLEAPIPLLPGRLDVFMNGAFVATTALEGKRAGESWLINLGVDRGVLARRERTADQTAETFFGVVDRVNKAREIVDRTTVENTREIPVRVELLERVPHSGTDRIVVKGVHLEPPPDQRDWQQRQGVMLWNLELPPGASREIVLRFSVKHPAEITPEGL